LIPDSAPRSIPLKCIKPHPLNAKIYRPINGDDPAVKVLAQSMRDNEFFPHEPIVLTSDYYVLSGHRRRVAAGLAGLEYVPCVMTDIRSDDEQVPYLIVTYNSQRVKTNAEVLHEELILSTAISDDSYREILEERRSAAVIDDEDAIEIVGVKKRSRISQDKTPFLEAICGVVETYKEFWPLTDRVIHYRLLNDPPLRNAGKPDQYLRKNKKRENVLVHNRYANVNECYKDTCDIVSRARLIKKISWAAIGDETRPVVTWDVHQGIGSFLKKQFDGFLKGYWRDLMASQPNHVEIVGEKNTIEGIIRPVAMQYTIPYTIGRGYASLDPRHKMAVRFRKSGKENLILLVLSDFDPEGDDIPHSFARSMRDDFGIKNIKAFKVGLTLDQVERLRLPPKLKAKESSSRHDGFVAKYGKDVHELESVEPDQLQGMLDESIRSVIDIDRFNAERKKEMEEIGFLNTVREKMKGMFEAIQEVLGQNQDMS
jgi:hypothetical protein